MKLMINETNEINSKKLIDDLYNNIIENNLTKEKLRDTLQEIKLIKLAILKRTRLRQLAELLKVSSEYLINIINEDYNNNASIVIMLNFNLSIKIIAKKISELNLEYSIITGKTDKQERINIINKFQRDEIRILIINMKAGGVGISLHDLNGDHPRISYISLSDDMIDVSQARGRIYRLNGKTKVIQKFIVVKNSIEEKIFENYLKKEMNMKIILEGNDLCKLNFTLGVK